MKKTILVVFAVFLVFMPLKEFVGAENNYENYEGKFNISLKYPTPEYIRDHRTSKNNFGATLLFEMIVYPEYLEIPREDSDLSIVTKLSFIDKDNNPVVKGMEEGRLLLPGKYYSYIQIMYVPINLQDISRCNIDSNYVITVHADFFLLRGEKEIYRIEKEEKIKFFDSEFFIESGCLYRVGNAYNLVVDMEEIKERVACNSSKVYMIYANITAESRFDEIMTVKLLDSGDWFVGPYTVRDQDLITWQIEIPDTVINWLAGYGYYRNMILWVTVAVFCSDHFAVDKYVPAEYIKLGIRI